jgi:hypothetical protein
MFDASQGKFYGVRGELDGYIDSCKGKQRRLIEALNEITDWRIKMAILDGELPPPPGGMSVEELLWHCEWQGAGLPLWRLIEDTKGYVAAARSAFLSPQKICSMHGSDFEENLDELAEAEEMAAEKQIQPDFAVTLENVNIGL